MSITVIGAEMMKSPTTVRISTELRDKLKKLGVKGETYEDIIQRLVDIAQRNGGKSTSQT